MKGTADGNLRRGARAEDLGVLLLSRLCAVAQVAREQDVGVDVIATLLRAEGSRRLVAEDSMFVQLKSVSVRSVVIEGAAVEWIYAMRLPVFVGSVDLDAGRIDLYTTHILSRTLLESKYSRIVLHLGPAPDQVLDQDVRHVPLFMPILSWSLNDISSDEWALSAYAVLRAWCALEVQNITTRRIGRFKPAHWETNELPQVSESVILMGGPQRETQNSAYIFSDMGPWVEALALHALVPNGKDPNLPAAILTIIGAMRHAGADPDPSGTLSQMLFHALARQSPT